MNNLSIVNIIDDENVFLINQLAEILGKGPNNIGIKLQNDKGEIYWGVSFLVDYRTIYYV